MPGRPVPERGRTGQSVTHRVTWTPNEQEVASVGAGRVVGGLVLVGVVAAGLSACAEEELPPATPRTSVTTSPTPSTTAPTTATATSTATSGPLPGLLLDLAEAARVVRDRSAINTAQGALQDGLTATRTGLKATRDAAFGASTRDCATVGARARSTRGSADVAIAAANTLDPMLDTRQAALDTLAAVIARIEAEAAGRPATATSPTPAELTAALDVARTEHTAGVDALAGARAGSVDGRAKAIELSATAQDIYASVC